MSEMSWFPIFMRLRGASALLVGGGAVAARKAELLLRAGARLTVVSPELGAGLRARHAAGEVRWIARDFLPADLAGMSLAFAATDRPLVNRFVSAQARRRNIPVNVADAPALCTFALPAIVDRSPLLIAVFSGGTAPVLARRLRERIESMIPAAYGRLARFAGRYRTRIKRRLPTLERRRRFWETVFDGPVAERVLAGDEAGAGRALERQLSDPAPGGGEVYLVGAGPGDPDLLTLRALRLMQLADVVLYDRLVSEGVLDRVRREADRIPVGKASGRHTLPQAEINRLMVRLAQEGKRVLRLKGGDPFMFGRGGEELEALAGHGIPFQVVPGITAAAGCAAYAGIPLTHRDYANGCQFVTAHLQEGALELDWERLARPRQTLVFYMGLQTLETLSRELIAHGMPREIPVALIERGTSFEQRVVLARLDDMAGRAREAGMGSPTLAIVGEVVRLREKLAWFATGPTRPPSAEWAVA